MPPAFLVLHAILGRHLDCPRRHARYSCWPAGCLLANPGQGFSVVPYQERALLPACPGRMDALGKLTSSTTHMKQKQQMLYIKPYGTCSAASTSAIRWLCCPGTASRGESVTFMLLAGICDAGAALVGGSTWTQRVRHREQARKGPLRRQVNQPTGGGKPAPPQTQHNHYYSVAFLFGQLQA